MKQFTTEMLYFIRHNFFSFFGVFFVAVFATYLVLFLLDVYPEPKDATSDEVEAVEEVREVAITVDHKAEEKEPEIAVAGDLPTAITFQTLGKTVKVLNSTSADMATLEADLQNGVVRHPDSAELGKEGNVVILGHSSYLPNVMNKNYQAFNGIQDMKWGELITVTSDDKEYVYRVDRVYKATTDEVVPVSGNKKMLTLVTCNVFGSKQDRYILEATLKEVNSL